MIEALHMLLLAIVQGLTEFLPVSSSGHLVLFQQILGSRQGDVFFDVILHCGTLGSVMLVYRRELKRLFRFDAAALKYMIGLFIGTIPAVIVGVFFRSVIEGLFHSPLFVGAGLILSATALFSTRWNQGRTAAPGQEWEPTPIAPLRALLIGGAQALAIVPGVSRSAMTIAASLWSGLERADAARFSFLLSIPAITGALVLQLADGAARDAVQIPWMVVSAIVAFGVGLLALRWTALAVVQAHFWKFGFYCLVLGVSTLFILR